MNIKKHLDLLGHKVKDKVSDFTGIVTGINFDLFGCIQADVRPVELDKEGKLTIGHWLDVSRLKVLSKKPVMDRPEFEFKNEEEKKEKISLGQRGCSEKTSIKV